MRIKILTLLLCKIVYGSNTLFAQDGFWKREKSNISYMLPLMSKDQRELKLEPIGNEGKISYAIWLHNRVFINYYWIAEPLKPELNLLMAVEVFNPEAQVISRQFFENYELKIEYVAFHNTDVEGKIKNLFDETEKDYKIVFSDSMKNIKGYGPEGKVWIIINADRWCVTTDLERYALFIKLDYLKHLESYVTDFHYQNAKNIIDRVNKEFIEPLFAGIPMSISE